MELSRRRNGFTIVEMMVSLLLSAIVVALIWGFFTSDQLRFRADHNRLSGMQGALQMDEALAWDLERISLALPAPGVPFTIDIPVVITDGRRLEFRIFAEDAPNTYGPRVVPVTYAHDPSSGQVTRTMDGKSRTFPGLVADDVQFTVVRLRPALPPVTGPETFTFARDVDLFAIKYVISCLPELSPASVSADRLAHEKMTLVGAVALPSRSDRMHNPYWRAGVTEVVGR